MPDQYYLTAGQVERIGRSLDATERTKKGVRQGASTNLPKTGIMYQGQISEVVKYDSTADPVQTSGKMTIWVEPDPGNPDSVLAAVDSDEIDDLVVWPSLIWPDKTMCAVGTFALAAWIAGRWRIIGAEPCPTPITGGCSMFWAGASLSGLKHIEQPTLPPLHDQLMQYLAGPK